MKDCMSAHSNYAFHRRLFLTEKDWHCSSASLSIHPSLRSKPVDLLRKLARMLVAPCTERSRSSAGQVCDIISEKACTSCTERLV